MDTRQYISEFSGMDRDRFEREILPLGKPAVLRQVIGHWPAVGRARASDAAISAYLKSCDSGKPANVIIGDAAIGGTFFYGETTKSFNFQRTKDTISAVLDSLSAEKSRPDPKAIAVQSARIADYLPRFRNENVLALLPAEVEPRIWVGNALRVQTHNDPTENIACVVAGERRFTLFPPEQIGNLYMGPLETTLAGTPVSMVKLEDPDFDRYPRFREALEVAMVADLRPGDAIYIPYLWLHHVHSKAAFNVLVNYWWHTEDEWRGSPYNTMLHAMLSLRDINPRHRDIWRKMFEYYVFAEPADAGAHLAPEERGALGALSPEMDKALKQQLVDALVRQWRLKANNI